MKIWSMFLYNSQLLLNVFINNDSNFSLNKINSQLISPVHLYIRTLGNPTDNTSYFTEHVLVYTSLYHIALHRQLLNLGKLGNLICVSN